LNKGDLGGFENLQGERIYGKGYTWHHLAAMETSLHPCQEPDETWFRGGTGLKIGYQRA
jgi:hypothetical protein